MLNFNASVILVEQFKHRTEENKNLLHKSCPCCWIQRWMECQLLLTFSKFYLWFYYLDFRLLWWPFMGHPQFSWEL